MSIFAVRKFVWTLGFLSILVLMLPNGITTLYAPSEEQMQKLLREFIVSSPENLRLYMRFMADSDAISSRPRYG
ncbi:hypothetical protein EG68_06734 [Paragonimus skrjabini miyazakii]|uniref:Uncharacterized protein n=1 Tax=Paragonimus skrjabini miyazakii TaxID=59628 RepID=A0A8S9YTR1_9TREM|nr:hypothetical protein EG68_06734 [Paragonimus skrjabini miyazakii]